jgi:VanZ family protein
MANFFIGCISVPNPPQLGNRKGTHRRPRILISDCRAGKIPLSSGVHTLRNLLFYWLPAGVWMALIFSASGDAHSYQHSSTLFVPLLHWLFPQMSAEHIESIHHLFRKCGHLSEYAILALLVWRAIHYSCNPANPLERNQKTWRWDEAGLTLAIIFFYAATDELHQVFVPTRTALVSDVFIDTTGAAAGLLALWLAQKIFRPAEK